MQCAVLINSWLVHCWGKKQKGVEFVFKQNKEPVKKQNIKC